MSITSHIFLLLFLPFIITLYYTVFRSSRKKMVFLLVISYTFYALAELKFLPVLFFLSFFTFWMAGRGSIKQGILINLAALVMFKYWDFGMETFNGVIGSLGLGRVGTFMKLGLPLGISFYIFKNIGYLLDVQRQRYAPTDDFWAFLTYSAYFPQISAGPISSYQDTAGQFSNLPLRLSQEQTYTGLLYLSIGLAKKVLIADTLGAFLSLPVNSVNGFTGALPAWYLVVAYAMQLYFDFSGYTDMVLGISAFFGIALPQNFNNPYLASNPGEFWERWHISLSNWFNSYLFSPLSRLLLRRWGASKRDQAQYAANLVTMSMVGFWHGTGWSFILWGAYHGLLLNINAWQKRNNHILSLSLSRAVFIFSLLLGWALFMSPNITYLRHLFLQLFGFSGVGLSNIIDLLKNSATPALLVGIIIATSGVGEAANILQATQGRSGWYALVWGVLAAMCLLLLGEQIQFLYIQF